jgi:hypothetical protein
MLDDVPDVEKEMVIEATGTLHELYGRRTAAFGNTHGVHAHVVRQEKLHSSMLIFIIHCDLYAEDLTNWTEPPYISRC